MRGKKRKKGGFIRWCQNGQQNNKIHNVGQWPQQCVKIVSRADNTHNMYLHWSSVVFLIANRYGHCSIVGGENQQHSPFVHLMMTRPSCAISTNKNTIFSTLMKMCSNASYKWVCELHVLLRAFKCPVMHIKWAFCSFPFSHNGGK